MKRYFHKTVASSILAICFTPWTAWAQDSDNSLGVESTNSGVGEIVVTARRREEALQDVPISVTAFSTQELAEKRIVGAQDLNASAPGLTLTGGNGVSRQQIYFAIRGQGQCTACANPGVITYFADVPDAATDSFFDLANVQVLKGPQGTLFGRNTTGGAVLLVPAAPTEEFSGFVTARIGSYNLREFEGALSGALTEGVLLRLAAQGRFRDGFTRNLTDGSDLDNLNRLNARFTLQLKPTDDIDITTIVFGQSLDENGTGQVINDFQPRAANAALYPLLAADAIAQQARGPRTVQLDPGLKAKSDIWGVINTSRWDISDSLYIKNIASYVHRKSLVTADIDGSYLPQLSYVEFPSLTAKPTISYSEEFQIGGEALSGSLNWLAGAFAEHRKSGPGKVGSRVYVGFPCAFLPAATQAISESAGDGFPGCLVRNTNNMTDRRQTTYAGFLHLEYAISPELTASGGFRHTEDEVSGRRWTTGSLTSTSHTPVAPRRKASFSGDSWDLTLQYQPTNDLMAYGAVRRGYRGGGLNISAPTSVPGIDSYAPETVTDFELGLKTDWTIGGIRGRFNFDAFYDKYSDIQRAVIYPIGNGLTTVVVRNAAKADIKGFDLEASVSPALGLDLTLYYTYTDAKYKEWPDIDPSTLAPIDRSGEVFANTPKHKFTVTPRASFELNDGSGELSFLAQITYQSRIGVNDINTPSSFVSPYTLVNLRADWRRVMGTRLGIGLFVTNLTEVDYPVSISDSTQGNSIGHVSYTYGEPRMFGVELHYDF